MIPEHLGLEQVAGAYIELLQTLRGALTSLVQCLRLDGDCL